MSRSVDLDELPIAVVVVGANRCIESANEAAARFTGRSLAELAGLDVADLLAPAGEDAPSWYATWHPSASLGSVTRISDHDVVIALPDGTTVNAVVAGRYRRDPESKALLGAVLALRPAAPRGKRVPTGIEVISTVSHELRSPLTSVKGYTSLLLNRWDRLSDEQKQMMLGQVHHDADRVTRLVNELLDISRLETGRLHLRRQMIDLVALAGTVVEKVNLEYPDLECTVDFPEDFPQVYADADKVEQVLTNLVENAAKYASPKGMRLDGAVDGSAVSVAVHDVGEGIPAADLPRVFTKFFRRDHGKPTGSGLGLWISRGLVEAHGGRLTAESTEGRGSTFRFTLPTDAFEKLIDSPSQ